MQFFGIVNPPDISVACGDSLISVGPIALNIDETSARWGQESLLPYILVNAPHGSAS